MRNLLILLLLLIALAGLGLGLMYSGAYDVSADEPHGPVVSWAMHETMRYSVRARAKEIVGPDLGGAETARTGLRSYLDMCEGCHGGPGVDPTALGKGLTPQPPDLRMSAHRWTTAELFWIIKHGVRMTGMPAWGKTHADEELWPIVALLERLPGMSPGEYQAMKAELEEEPHVH